MPDQKSPFSKTALPTNQSGRLSDEQSQLWRNIAKFRRHSVRGVAYVFAFIGAFLLLANGPAAKAAARANGGMIFLAIAAILVVAASLEPVNADVREGRVESVEGAIAKRFTTASKVPGSRSYYLHVGGRRLQTISRVGYEAAPDAGYVRVYFLPRSRRVVNLEELPDPPIPTGSGAAQQILQGYAQALMSFDRTAIAESAAEVMALKHAVEGPSPAAPADRRDRAQSSRLQADDLYGTWTNPVVSVTFMKNGTATMTMAIGGTRREGRWSVDANGKLVVDATGNLEPVEASLNGNKLTIVIDGQRVGFTRVT